MLEILYIPKYLFNILHILLLLEMYNISYHIYTGGYQQIVNDDAAFDNNWLISYALSLFSELENIYN